MIIEIALGIVLAVVILALLVAFRWVILALAAVALLVGLVIAGYSLSDEYPRSGVIMMLIPIGFIAAFVFALLPTRFQDAVLLAEEPASPTTKRLLQDDAERASGTPQQSTQQLDAMPLKSRLAEFKSRKREQAAQSSKTANRFAGRLLDWIRARKKKMPPGSP